MSRTTKQSAPAALVTGAAVRIGRAIAEHLSERGYHIALHYYRSKTDAETIAKHIRQNGGSCELFSADLSRTTPTQQLVKKVATRFPGLNLLINSASTYVPTSIQNFDAKLSDKIFALNLRAPMILTSEFARRCSHPGNIINIVDARVRQNKTDFPDYLLTKKCLAEFTKLAAMELAPHIRVNAIAPGTILPPPGKGEDYLKKRIAQVPLKKKGTLSDVTQAIDYLIANTYLTGQILFIDGGLHLN